MSSGRGAFLPLQRRVKIYQSLRVDFFQNIPQSILNSLHFPITVLETLDFTSLLLMVIPVYLSLNYLNYLNRGKVYGKVIS